MYRFHFGHILIFPRALRPNVHNEERAACGPSLSIVGLGIVAQTAEEVSLAKAALSSLAP